MNFVILLSWNKNSNSMALSILFSLFPSSQWNLMFHLTLEKFSPFKELLNHGVTLKTVLCRILVENTV